MKKNIFAVIYYILIGGRKNVTAIEYADGCISVEYGTAAGRTG